MTSEHRQEEYVTTAHPQHAQPGRVSQAWRRFRRWRRTRPFWGGLFTALAGLEIFSTTQMSLGGLTFQMGPSGFLSWLIPAILIACGMLMWFTPQQRMFYAIVGSVTAVFSLIGVNLGGFFVGLLLGMVGSALGFAWVPRRPASAPAEPEPTDAPSDAPSDPQQEGVDGPTLVDELMPGEEVTGPLTDTLPRPRNPLREPMPTDGTHRPPAVGPEDGPRRGPHRDPKLLAVTLVLLSVSAAGALALRDQAPVRAAPAKPCAAPSTIGKARPSLSPFRPAGTSRATSPEDTGPEKPSEGNLLTDTSRTDGDGAEPASGDTQAAEPTTSPEPTGSPTATPSATPTGEPSATGRPTPSASATGEPDDPGCVTPTPTKPGGVEAGEPLPGAAAEPGQPRVAAKPSKLTGSKVTMTDLHFAGIVELPTAEGELRALKFTMSRGVTDDFLLQTGGSGKTLRYATDRLTVEGDVAFYATRFVGWLAGIKITLAPDLPFPEGLPVTFPAPVTFTDPEIDLAYVDSGTLTAKPALTVTLA
ncbi:DUF6114 domain-containing protein [Micromonospora sp. B11E3]|uniref:DUF6114 domain-containing protein n=1 Tax=Micromonospora sp. B11E3 TaxID=3153562 RepID=UPI00325C5744